MTAITHRPESLWNQKALTPSVSKYIRAYRGEFDADSIESEFLYRGPASAAFRRLTKIDPSEGFDRFEGRGSGLWTLRNDRILNPLTADLLAAADTLGGELETKSSSAFPGGIGADSRNVWVTLLDGGVGVEVVLWELQTTNRVKARQRTTIRGPKAYRVLLELLGFDRISRKLHGESVIPPHDEIMRLTNALSVKGAR